MSSDQGILGRGYLVLCNSLSHTWDEFEVTIDDLQHVQRTLITREEWLSRDRVRLSASDQRWISLRVDE